MPSPPPPGRVSSSSLGPSAALDLKANAVSNSNPSSSSYTPSHPDAPAPSLLRRSSYEPLRLGLASLPPPQFSRAPPGQRSVPAVEFLHSRPSSLVIGGGGGASSSSSSLSIDSAVGVSLSSNTGGGGLASVASSNAGTPLALGNGAMNVEPWNLWSDPSAPTSSNANSTAGVVVGGLAAESDHLADAFARSVAIDTAAAAEKAVKRLSKSSPSASSASAAAAISNITSNHVGGTQGSTWSSNDFNATQSMPAQNYTSHDTSVSPANNKLKSVSSGVDLSSLGGTQRASSLLQRNVSFSSLLDLSGPGTAESTVAGAGTQSDVNTSLSSSVGADGLVRAASFNSGPRGGAPAVPAANGSSTGSSPKISKSSLLSGTRSSASTAAATQSGSASSLPSLSFASTVPSAGSFASGFSGIDDATAGAAPSAVTTLSRNNSIVASGIGGAMSGGTPISRLTGAQSYTAGMTMPSELPLHMNTGSRARQQSAFSDASITSVPFGPFYHQQASGDPYGHTTTADATFAAFGNPANPGAGIFGAPPMRRDSGYGLSVYNTTPSMQQYGTTRRPSQQGWGQAAQYGSPLAGRGNPYSLTPSPPAPYGLSPEISYNGAVGVGSSPSSGMSSSTPSMYRYSGADYLGNGSGPGGSMPNFPLGLVGSVGSPYLPLGGLGCYDRPRGEDKSRPIRSPLLEEFRADRSRRWEVKDFVGHIAEFMCDQVGSRYIQEHILENPSVEDCDYMYEEVWPCILQLAEDVFANFCVQRLFEKATSPQVDNMIAALKGSVLRLALGTYGCRVIQKALEVVSPDGQVMIVRELEGAVQKCVRDQNANHVIQKVVQTVPADQLSHIVASFVGHVYTFATHPYSCRVLQRIFENCPDRMTRPLLEELKSYAQTLMQDQYGNYVVQFVIEKGLPHDKSDIICQIYGQVLHLSKHKFASNVIEKCIINATEPELTLIAHEVLVPRMDGLTGVMAMLRHEYANYPLQRLLKHTSGATRQAIVEQVSGQLIMFRHANPPFNAKHLVAIEKLLYDVDPNAFPSLYPRSIQDHYVSSRK